MYSLKQELRWHINNGCKVFLNGDGCSSASATVAATVNVQSSPSPCGGAGQQQSASPDSTTAGCTANNNNNNNNGRNLPTTCEEDFGAGAKLGYPAEGAAAS